MRRRHRLQIVDIVEKNPLQPVHLRINIPRHRDIDKEHRPVLPQMQKTLPGFLPKNRLRRPRRSNHNIRRAGRIHHPLPGNHLRRHGIRKPLRHLHRALLGPVRHQNRPHPAPDQVPRRQLAHLARAHQKNRLAAERAKDLPRQIDRNRSNRNRRAPNLRLRPHLLRRRKSRL